MALADMLWPALSSVASASPGVCWLPSHFVHDPVFSSGVFTSLSLRPARPASQIQLLHAWRASVTHLCGKRWFLLRMLTACTVQTCGSQHSAQVLGAAAGLQATAEYLRFS